HWSLTEVNQQLEAKLVSSFRNVWDAKEEKGLNMRDTSLAIGVSRVAEAIKMLGLFP
ncbi:MAG: glutamate dehydrogenase, partial [Methanosarcinales archaeon]|nr:glutamate dehydrogenase [Methanosarcinales archaeon]